MSIFLASYTFRVHPKNQKDNFREFNGVGPRGLHDALHKFFEALETRLKRDDDVFQMLGAENVVSASPAIYGHLKAGAFDVDSEMRHIESQEVAFRRTREHAELMSYYFHLYVPNDKSTKGILITERRGVHGRHTVLVRALEKYLAEFYGLGLVVNEVIPTELYKTLKEGKIETVTFKHVQFPRYLGDRVNWKPEEVEEVADVQLVVRAKKGLQLPISDVLRGRLTAALEREIAIDGSDLEPIEVKVNYNKTQRSVKLDRPGRIAPMIDVTDDLKKVTGLPPFGPIHAVTETFVQQLIAEIGGLK